MNWVYYALIGAVLVGVSAGTVLVVRNGLPYLLIGLGTAMAKAALPFILKRMAPEEEAQWREAERAGRGDEWLRKRLGSLRDR